MAQSEIVKKYKNLGTASMWCAIGSLLVFFLNIIALIAFLAIAISINTDEGWNAFRSQIMYLTLITELISLACVIVWMVMAIIEMKMVRKNQELRKYHPGGFTSWILGMIVSLSFIFLSLLMFILFAAAAESIVYITFVLYLFATIGSILYIAGIARDIKKIQKDGVQPTKKAKKEK